MEDYLFEAFSSSHTKYRHKTQRYIFLIYDTNKKFKNLCDIVLVMVESVGIDPDAEEKHYLVRQLPSYPDDISWKERYKRLARNLFVMHHKYNSINTFALQVSILPIPSTFRFFVSFVVPFPPPKLLQHHLYYAKPFSF